MTHFLDEKRLFPKKFINVTFLSTSYFPAHPITLLLQILRETGAWAVPPSQILEGPSPQSPLSPPMICGDDGGRPCTDTYMYMAWRFFKRVGGDKGSVHPRLLFLNSSQLNLAQERNGLFDYCGLDSFNLSACRGFCRHWDILEDLHYITFHQINWLNEICRERWMDGWMNGRTDGWVEKGHYYIDAIRNQQLHLHLLSLTWK